MTTRATRHLIEVSAISDITAWYRRISFDPLGLFGFYRPAPAAYLMLTVPTLDGQGRVQRAYSLVGQPGQTCAFDFVLHHPVGPASQWAAQAEPGRRLAVTEPPYHLAIPPVGHATIIGDTSANLIASAAGEHHEYTVMYPQFADIAQKEGFGEIAQVMRAIAVAEQFHERRFLDFLKNIKEGRVFKRQESTVWRCRNCGYIHHGTAAPDQCPACAHDLAYFELFGANW
jgi:rubrerythrin